MGQERHQPPRCKDCALAAAGVRKFAGRKTSMSKRQLKELKKEWKRNRRTQPEEVLVSEHLGINAEWSFSGDSLPAGSSGEGTEPDDGEGWYAEAEPVAVVEAGRFVDRELDLVDLVEPDPEPVPGSDSSVATGWGFEPAEPEVAEPVPEAEPVLEAWPEPEFAEPVLEAWPEREAPVVSPARAEGSSLFARGSQEGREEGPSTRVPDVDEARDALLEMLRDVPVQEAGDPAVSVSDLAAEETRRSSLFAVPSEGSRDAAPPDEGQDPIELLDPEGPPPSGPEPEVVGSHTSSLFGRQPGAGSDDELSSFAFDLGLIVVGEPEAATTSGEGPAPDPDGPTPSGPPLEVRRVRSEDPGS